MGLIVPGAEKNLLRRFEAEVEMKRIILVPVSNDVRREFEAVLKVCYNRGRPIRVRTLDALHLASALASRAREIICTDARMREAASTLQLDIQPRKSG